MQALKVLIVSGMEHKFQKGKSVRVLAVDSYSVHFLCVHVGNCPRTCRNDTVQMEVAQMEVEVAQVSSVKVIQKVVQVTCQVCHISYIM